MSVWTPSPVIRKMTNWKEVFDIRVKDLFLEQIILVQEENLMGPRG
jgi:hypothetical protein